MVQRLLQDLHQTVAVVQGFLSGGVQIGAELGEYFQLPELGQVNTQGTSDLFHSLGLGGAAQTKAVKKIAGSLRIDLAQFRELEVFTQFSSDLDPATKEALDHGNRLVEILKQPLYHPMAVSRQVVILYAATQKLLADVPVEKVREVAWGLADEMTERYPDVMKSIDDTGELSAQGEEAIRECCETYKKQVSATWQA
mgnify:CR=1 FL=1